jgi:hypothetical protein
MITSLAFTMANADFPASRRSSSAASFVMDAVTIWPAMSSLTMVVVRAAGHFFDRAA